MLFCFCFFNKFQNLNLWITLVILFQYLKFLQQGN